MKKVVRMLGLCALVALAFTACKKKETNGNVAFKCAINQPTSERTQMYPGGDVKWSANDKIVVLHGTAEHISPVVKDEGVGNLVGQFEGDGAFLSDLKTTTGEYTSFYPVINEAEAIGTNTVTLTVPEQQTYVNGTFGTNLYPMYAANEEDNFSFVSDAGVFALSFLKASREVDPTFTRIVLTAEADGTQDLVGKMIYSIDNPSNGYTVDAPNNLAEMVCDPNLIELRTGDPTFFNFVVLPGTYNFSVQVFNGNTAKTLYSGGTNGISGEIFHIQNVEITSQKITIPLSIILDEE